MMPELIDFIHQTDDAFDAFIGSEGFHRIQHVAQMEDFLILAAKRFHVLDKAFASLDGEGTLTDVQEAAWAWLSDQFSHSTSDLRMFFSETDDYPAQSSEERRRLNAVADALVCSGRDANKIEQAQSLKVCLKKNFNVDGVFMKLPSEMSFEEFANSVKPSGAVNRFPSIGAGADVVSYSVYMNGPLATQLPMHVREHEFKDVMLHALTEKLNLNSSSFRDNLKVAEIVAARSAWMTAVLELSCDPLIRLSDGVTKDYELLTDGMTHPWILNEIKKQQELSIKLQPVLDRAGEVIGVTVTDRAPKEISRGKVVSQNENFTVQKTMEGEVVTHENRRLNALPVVGTDVSVSYYRGSGQVVDSLDKLFVSRPFIDSVSGDLAVVFLADKDKEQILLFNSVSGFETFVKVHGLDSDLVRHALNVREAIPKKIVAVSQRTLVSEVYIDAKAGCLAIDYRENGITYSALFSSAEQMKMIGKEFGLGNKEIAASKKLENSVVIESAQANVERHSIKDLKIDIERAGFVESIGPVSDGRSYIGSIVAANALYVAQSIGRKTVVIHDLRALDKKAELGDSLNIKYGHGRGQVFDLVRKRDGLDR